MSLQQEQITQALATSDRAVVKAIMIVDRNQTDDEKISEATKYHNGRGWQGSHARMGSSFAKFFKRNGYLTTRQIAYFRKTDKRGIMRIALYWQQLADAAKSNPYTLPATPVVRMSKPRLPVPPKAGRSPYGKYTPPKSPVTITPKPAPAPPVQRDFNEEWAGFKNEFARREIEQDQAAFEAGLDREIAENQAEEFMAALKKVKF